jgi:hypothetical protein
VDAGELSRLQLIIRPGKEGGIITQTEFMFSKFCAEEKLKTKTSEHPGLSVDAGELSRLQQLIIRPGEGGGIITQTEFMFPMFCAEEKLKKKTSDRLISMIKRRNFVIEDICAGTIRELSWKHLQSFTSIMQLGRQVPGFKFRTSRFSCVARPSRKMPASSFPSS